MGRSRYQFGEDGCPYFCTCTIVGWLPIFARPETAQIILDSWKFLQENNRLVIFGYVILENHLHFIAAGNDVAKELGDFKSYTARRIIDLLEQQFARNVLELLQYYKARHKVDRAYQLWQEGSHPKRVHDEEMMGQKLDYIHRNPVKRGYVDEPAHWRYSSARNYAGQPGLLHVNTQW